MREAAQDEYVLLAEGHLFSAIIRHPASTYGSATPPVPPPMKQFPMGATVEVTGICILEDSNPFDRNVPFDLMMRSYDDIAVVARPSWMTVRNLVLVISVMLVVILGVTAWGWMLRRKVRRQTEVLAARAAAEAEAERQNARLQQQRSRILEDINGSRPLVEVLEEITELVSFQLNGAPCWCEIVDGARLGAWPTNRRACAWCGRRSRGDPGRRWAPVRGLDAQIPASARRSRRSSWDRNWRRWPSRTASSTPTWCIAPNSTC